MKNKLFSIPTFGMFKNVKRVYLTSDEGYIPHQIKEKMEKIDVKALWIINLIVKRRDIKYIWFK
ncbi:Uncharacterised protein [Actinobacillus equuli]|nr:Uncharacterised protein [Actinobacillus equuli]